MNQGFSLPGKDHAILCIHGYSATPQTFSELGPFLQKQLGYHIHAPVLPGHGGHYKDMDTAGYQDWITCIASALFALKENFKNVHLVGLSMGGTLCHHIAQLHPEAVASLNLMAPGLRFHKPSIHKLMHVIRYLPKPILQKWVRHKPEMHKAHITYPSYSMLSAVIAFNFFHLTEKTSKYSDVPCLIQTPFKDKAVDPISSDMLAEFYATCELLKMKDSGHIMVCAPAKDFIFENILRWIQRHS